MKRNLINTLLSVNKDWNVSNGLWTVRNEFGLK